MAYSTSVCGKAKECNYFFSKVKRGQGEQQPLLGSVKVREVVQ